MDLPDLNSHYEVTLHRDLCSSVCRLCGNRTRFDHEAVFVRTSPTWSHGLPDIKHDCYCRVCYSYLHGKACSELPGMPLFDHIEKSQHKPTRLTVYNYLVKDRHAFTLWHPVDPVDVGLLKQRADAAHSRQS